MRAATVCFVLASTALSAAADTLVLKGGKKLEGVVAVERGDVIVVNPYNSRWPEMEYGITAKERYPREKVAELTIADPPLHHYRERASSTKLDAAGHLELAKFCESNKLTEERDRELKLALACEPTNAEALAALGRGVWAAWAKGNPVADPDLAALEREYLKLEKPAELQAQWEQMTGKGTTRPRPYLERARRSAKFPLGRRDKVPLTVRSELSPGATYAIYLPKTYDPLVPTGLVLGLHGGGRGGNDPTLVTGSGESALDFYVDVADDQDRGVIVVCPTALVAGWPEKKNEVLIDSVLEEMRLLYNVDENRIWLTGHSMGGGGAWHWGPKRAEVWAAFSPCAGFMAGPTGGVPVYIYHGTDDQICGVQGDRTAADGLRDAKADFVYTEVDKVGHGFPDWVRHDIFRFFAAHWKDDGKKRAVWPRSSFDRKVGKDEVKCFGDPAASASAAAGGGDAKLAELIASLEKGGGRGVEAAKALATRKDAATVAAVAKVLHSKKTTTDAKVLAARTIGEIGISEGVKPLAAEAGTEDFRVLDVVVEALGRIGGKDAADPLVRAARQFGAFWEKSNSGGQFSFTEYEARCQSFGRVCDAMGGVADAAAFVPVIEKEIVLRVFAPVKPYAVPVDERFVKIPPRARLDLMRSLRACLAKLKDPRGKALLAAAKAPWSAESQLVAEADAGIAEL